MSSVSTILQSAAKLPPFPSVVQRALQLIQDPNSSVQDIVNVIQYDQSITMSVLKLCNSAYFGLPRAVHSLREALVLIGFNQLLEIILSQQSASVFYKSCQGYDLKQGELWQHSVACALLPQIISKRLGGEATPTHFTVALLHDIGKMVLGKFVKDYFAEIQKRVSAKDLTFAQAEKEVLGIDHAELGGRILEQWGFPAVMVSAVRYHHTPFAGVGDGEMVRLVCLCDLIAMMSGRGGGADESFDHTQDELMRHFQLKEEDIQQLMAELDDRFKAMSDLLEIK
ncbi:MAG: HDOD domain-containing protein [Thermodesulfobacteriota bacterium]